MTACDLDILDHSRGPRCPRPSNSRAKSVWILLASSSSDSAPVKPMLLLNEGGPKVQEGEAMTLGAALNKMEGVKNS